MSDEFSPYLHGLCHLLAQLRPISAEYQNALLLQQRLERNIAEARNYGPDPTQRSELNRILNILNDLSLQTTGKSFDTWCKMPPIAQQAANSEEMLPGELYLGKLEAVHAGNIHQELTDQLVEIGAKPKVGKKTLQEDILERYTTISLHAIFLYTSQDEAIAPYILEHWGSLDTLSGDVCDIHPIVDQFHNVEDAYNYIEQLDVVKQANFRSHSKLPGLFFWDHEGGTEYVSFGPLADSREITHIVRVIFEEIHRKPVIASITYAKRLLMRKDKYNQ